MAGYYCGYYRGYYCGYYQVYYRGYLRGYYRGCYCGCNGGCNGGCNRGIIEDIIAGKYTGIIARVLKTTLYTRASTPENTQIQFTYTGVYNTLFVTFTADNLSVRNSTGGIVQFKYGGDGLDPTHIEGKGIPVDPVRVMQHVRAMLPSRYTFVNLVLENHLDSRSFFSAPFRSPLYYD